MAPTAPFFLGKRNHRKVVRLRRRRFDSAWGSRRPIFCIVFEASPTPPTPRCAGRRDLRLHEFPFVSVGVARADPLFAGFGKVSARQLVGALTEEVSSSMSPDFIPPTQHSVSAVPDNPLFLANASIGDAFDSTGTDSTPRGGSRRPVFCSVLHAPQTPPTPRRVG